MSRLRVLTSAAVRFNRLMSELRPDVIFFTLPMGALLLPLYRGNAKRVYESHSARQFTPYHSLFSPMVAYGRHRGVHNRTGRTAVCTGTQ